MVAGVASAASAGDGGFGRRRSGGYGGLRGRREGWAGSEAHGESDGEVSELGDGPEQSGRQGGSPATGEEEDDVGGITGLPAPSALVRRKRGTRRGFLARRRGVGWPVAVVEHGGALWCAREEREREPEEGKEVQGERGEDEGVGGCAWRRPGSRGGHAGREEPARLAGHRARSCFSSWQEEEDSAAPGGPGWLWPVGHYSGGLHGKVPLFFIFPVFYYSATLWLY